VALTSQELDLLVLLMIRKDAVVPFDVVTQWLWEAEEERYELRLRALVHRLIAKLSASDPYTVRRVRRRGYWLVKARQDDDIQGLSTPKA
jgi:DNA-binding response OmpR family regulator